MSVRGASLIELVLLTGIVMALSAGAFAIYKIADGSSARQEAEMAGQLVAVYRNANEVPMGHYTDIASTPLDLAPPGLVDGGALRSRWGPIELAPEDVGARHNGGFSMRYSEVPADQCSAFVRQLPAGARKIVVGQVVVSDSSGLDRQALALGCASASRVDVTYHHDTGAAGDHRPIH